MNIQDIKTRDDLTAFYEENGLLTAAEKIDYLISVMKIKAIISEEPETEEENLAGLEDVFLDGFWQAE